jgi:hypothetical protein
LHIRRFDTSRNVAQDGGQRIAYARVYHADAEPVRRRIGPDNDYERSQGVRTHA